MKQVRILILILLFFSSYVNAGMNTGNEKEYLVMRVYHRIKNTDVISSLYIQTGDYFPHSLKGKLENGDDGAVKIINESGKIMVVHTEADILNYLAAAGWNLFSSYPIQVLDRSYVQYIFVKEK